MKPKLSIIVPVYNVEEYLEKCIKSIINQTYQDFELILINDGSTDSSGLICDNFANLDSRIIVKHKENGGQSSARNLGIDIAKGTYIGFVDSDDWIHKGMYLKLINHAIEFDSDIAACNFLIMKKDGKFEPYLKAAINREYDCESAIKEIYKNEVLTFSPCNKVYKRILFEDIKFLEGSILEDKDISYKLIYKSKKISYIKEELYFYRYNAHSTLRNKFTIKRLDEYTVQKNMYNFYKEQYPNISDYVYFGLFDIGTFLYAQILINLKNEKIKYRYLIEFDNDILTRLLKSKQLSKKNKIKIWLALYFPSVSVNIIKVLALLRNM